MLPFAAMVGLARFLKPRVFLHGCTRQFDCSTLSANLPEHELHKAILEPAMFGMPVRRGRSYAALIRRDFTLRLGLEHIRKFFTTCDLGSEVFFAASDSEAAGLDRRTSSPNDMDEMFNHRGSLSPKFL